VVEAVRLGIKGDGPRASYPLDGDIKLGGLTDDFDRKN
jgi:hypothetical protein